MGLLLGDGSGDAEQGEYLPGGDAQTRQRERQRRTAEDRRFKRWADGGKLAGVFVIVAWIMRDRLLLPEYTAACQVQMDVHRVGYWWILCLVISPLTMNRTSSAMLVAWSAMRSRLRDAERI